MNSEARIQELQNEVNCMNDPRDFKDAESERSGQSHVTCQPPLFPPFRDPGGMLSRSVGMPSRNDRPPSIWDTHGLFGKRFCKSNGVFFSTLSASGQSLEFLICQNITSPHVDEGRPNTKHSFGSKFKELCGRPTTTAGVRIFILTNCPTKQHLLVGR